MPCAYTSCKVVDKVPFSKEHFKLLFNQFAVAEFKEKHGVWDPMPEFGVDYNLTLCPFQSRLQHIYHGQPYAMSRLNPPVRDFGFSLRFTRWFLMDLKSIKTMMLCKQKFIFPFNKTLNISFDLKIQQEKFLSFF